MPPGAPEAKQSRVVKIRAIKRMIKPQHHNLIGNGRDETDPPLRLFLASKAA